MLPGLGALRIGGPCTLPLDVKRPSSMSELSDLNQVLKLMRHGEVKIVEEMVGYVLYDLKYQNRAPDIRATWRRLGFDRWDYIIKGWVWIHQNPLPVEIMQLMAGFQRRSIERILTSHEHELIRGTEPLFKLRVEGERAVVHEVNGGQTYDTRILWRQLGCDWDKEAKVWYGDAHLATVFNDWMARVIENKLRQRKAQTEKMMGYLEKLQKDPQSLSNEEAAYYDEHMNDGLYKYPTRQELLHRHQQKQIKEYSIRLGNDPFSLSDEERTYYDQHRDRDAYPPWQTYYDRFYEKIRRKILQDYELNDAEEKFLVTDQPGVAELHRLQRIRDYRSRIRRNPLDLSEAEREEYDQHHRSANYPSWQHYYDQFYDNVRRKIIDGAELDDAEKTVLSSKRQMDVEEAIRTVIMEEAETSVNARLARRPALSVAKGEPIKPPWVAFVVEAVLMTQESATQAINKEFKTRGLSMATTVLHRRMMLNTPLGQFEIYVRNQPSAQDVVWNLYVQNSTTKSVANVALKARNYQQNPVQIRDSKTLIIALNAIAAYMLAHGHPDLPQIVHDWVKTTPIIMLS